jgi:hypothetical protein
MSDINADIKKFGLTRRQFIFFLSISIFWLTCCVSLLIPTIRNFIIRFGEVFIVHRPLTYPVWHERFIIFSIRGIVLYICFWFFLSIFFPSIIAGKKRYIFAAVISLISVFIIMYKAGWTFSDDHEFISTTAINKYTPNFVSGGRFAPFKYIKYNILLFVFRCLGINTGLPVEAHFIVVSMFFMVTFFCLFFLINKIEPVKIKDACPVINSFFSSTFFLLGSSFCSVFLRLIFPETEVIMSFAVFMLMYYKALETDKTRYYTAAFLSAVYGTYCKEPVFGAFAVIAFVNYLFRYKKSKQDKIFYIALMANGVLFIFLYYFLSFKNASGFYNEGIVSIKGFKFLLSVLKGNPVLIIMFCFSLFRLYFVIVRKEKNYLFYDSLLFAGIAYAFAYFILRLNSDYYYLPSIILFLPSLVHWIKYLFLKKRAFAVTLFIILLPLYSYNSFQTAARIRGIWRERQEFMPYITSLLSDYNNGKKFIWYESDNKTTDGTFYITVRDWRKYIENAFLNYLNKSEGMDFFVSEKRLDHTIFYQNTLFFYPVDNDQWQPMRDELVKTLKDNNFALYKDSYGVLIYKQY